MSKREDTLAAMRIAGYHNDKAAFTRLLVENRIRLTVADEAWLTGRKQRANGMKCACYECSRGDSKM
ncbi:Uncharacterised protein [uncultured Comamonas sp.]|nr:Uncharacterised protein [uncultured Comamonas sp.]